MAEQNLLYFGMNSAVDNITVPDYQILGNSKVVRVEEKLENEISQTKDEAERTEVEDIEEDLSELKELLPPGKTPRKIRWYSCRKLTKILDVAIDYFTDSPGNCEEHAENVSVQKTSKRRKRSSKVLDGEKNNRYIKTNIHGISCYHLLL